MRAVLENRPDLSRTWHDVVKLFQTPLPPPAPVACDVASHEMYREELSTNTKCAKTSCMPCTNIFYFTTTVQHYKEGRLQFYIDYGVLVTCLFSVLSASVASYILLASRDSRSACVRAHLLAYGNEFTDECC